MQEHIEWLKKEKDEHGYEKHPYFECAIEHAESLLEKEEEQLCEHEPLHSATATLDYCPKCGLYQPSK